MADRFFLQHRYHAFNIIGQPGIIFFPCKAVNPLRRIKKLSDHRLIAQFRDRVAVQKIIKKIRRKSGIQLILGPTVLRYCSQNACSGLSSPGRKHNAHKKPIHKRRTGNDQIRQAPHKLQFLPLAQPDSPRSTSGAGSDKQHPSAGLKFFTGPILPISMIMPANPAAGTAPAII